jgi:N-acetylglucosaminyldiphosphoundecaprenol N-acetyl-beta-D-mannosaminyltransferase
VATEVAVSTGSASPRALLTPVLLTRLNAAERRRVAIGPIYVDSVDSNAAVERIRTFALSGQPHQVVTVNLDFVSIAGRDPAFRATINSAALAVPDGMPLVWASRLKGEPLPERVAGVELVSESCRIAAETGGGVFLLGAAPGVAGAAARRLETMYPGLKIAGVYSPPMGPSTRRENERIIRMIRDAQPQFLFVALGAPRQELWIRKYQPRLEVPVAMGVGCVLDVLAGSVKRAPRWMQRTGLEWAFRLGQEPQRLWRRYLVDDLPVLARILVGSPWDAQPEGAAGIS